MWKKLLSTVNLSDIFTDMSLGWKFQNDFFFFLVYDNVMEWQITPCVPVSGYGQVLGHRYQTVMVNMHSIGCLFQASHAALSFGCLWKNYTKDTSGLNWYATERCFSLALETGWVTVLCSHIVPSCRADQEFLEIHSFFIQPWIPGWLLTAYK